MYKIAKATLKFVDLVVIFVMAFGGPTSALAQGITPQVTSDRADYSPGDPVVITGTYWVADTQVRVVVNDAIGQTWTHDVIVNVTDGGFVDSFNLPATFISDYGVTATGVQSGQTATATFTDAPALTVTKTVTPLTYNAAGQVLDYSYEVKNTGNQTATNIIVTDDKASVSCPDTTLAVGASMTCTGTYTIKAGDVTFGYVANKVTATANGGSVVSNTDVKIATIPLECRNDSEGVNDVSGQKDLTTECSAPTAVNPEVISWNWDIIAQSGANTADGCALFDTDNDGLANYSLCVSWQGSRVMQPGYPVLYSCNDAKSNTCPQSVVVPITNGTACAVELAGDDPFPAGEANPQDTKAVCSVNLADVGGSLKSTLIDVCSYPSESPTSAPTDCVVISTAKGNLEVIKDVVPDDSNTNWDISWTGPTPYSGTITGDGVTDIQPVDAGTYTITEAAGTGTNLSLYSTTWACTVNGSPSTSGTGTTISSVAVGKADVVICTFTNTRNTASLTIKKNVVPDDANTNWDFNISGPTTGSCSIAGDGSCDTQTVQTGSYSITETAGANTSLGDYGTSYACTVNGNAGASGSGATISGLSISSADVVVCTFTNSLAGGTLTVNKTVVPASDTGKFNLLIDTVSKASDVGDGGTTGAVAVSAGSHTVGESAGTGTDLTNYVVTIGGDCDTSGNVTVGPNQNKVCTITNTRKGNIIIKKVTDPAGEAGNFTFTGAVSGTIGHGGSLTASNLAPGPYTVKEITLASDFQLETISCDDTNSTGSVATATASITLDPGETVTCTFTNLKLFPDLAVTKTADAASVTAGDAVGFSIELKNDGEGTAYNVSLSDTLPAISGVTWAIASQPNGNPCTLTGGSLSCTFGNLAAGASTGTIHITGRSTGASCGTWNNTASAQADNNSTVTGSASILVDCADIKITKTAGSSTVSAGDPISFTIVVTNDGSGTARGVTMTDTLPAKAGLGAWALSGTDAGACSISAGVLTCNFGDIAGHASKTVSLTASTTAATCGTVSNTASVTTSNDGTGQSTASVTVQCPNLSVTKAADAATVNAGDAIGFTITVDNAGPGVAKGVTLTDALPAGLTWTMDPPVAGCSITGQNLTCNLGNMASGASVSVHVAATSLPTVCGALTNTATATPTNGAAATSGQATITVNCADVTVSKSGNGPLSAGDTATFTFGVSVTGSGSLKNVTLSDTLPAGVAWAIAPSTACSISGLPQVLNCAWPSLAAGTTISIPVSGTSSATNCSAPLNNTATVAAANETDTTNNSASASITVNCAEIHIEKSTTSPIVSAGSPINFTVTASNTGAGIARSVVVTDSLPMTAGINWSISPAVSGCSITGGVLTCNFGDIAPAGSKSVTLTSPTTAASCGTINNTASVTTTNDGSGQASASVTVNCPDLQVSKTGNGPINAGDTAIYTIVITNSGAGNATGVTLSDQLPANIDWKEDSAACSIGQSGLLTCSFGTLAAGASITIHVSGVTSGNTCGPISNTVTVAATNEADTSDNSATGSVTVNCAEIGITKTAASPISAGDTLTYTIVVSNTGAGTAYGVNVVDTLPTSAGLGPWIVTPGSPTCTITAGVLTCSFGDLLANASKTITLSSPTTYATCGTVSNEAQVTTTNDGSGTAGADVTVQCPALEVTKTADASTVSAGDTIGFTIAAKNGGPGKAYGVTISDTLPTSAGLSWTISPAAAGCSIAGGVLTCNVGTLIADQAFTVHVSSPTTAATCGTVTNSASVSTTNDGSGLAGDSITVNCPDLTISKTAASGTVSAGDTISYQITVKNNGTGTARNVTLSDTLPTGAGLNWSVGGTGAGSCSITSGVLACNFGNLAPSAVKTITVSSPTTAASCATINNTATVAASNEANTSNNSASASITVNCPDVTVTKAAVVGTINASDTAAFKIVVTNSGAGTAYNVTVTDTLPAGVTWSINPAVTGCSITGNTLSCSFATLAAGASIEINVSGTAPASVCGTLNNTVTVAATNEANTGNNGASASITVNCPDVTVTKTAAVGTISAGDTAAFKIVVTNSGAGTAYSVTVTDTLPAGIAWTIDPAATGCSITGGVLSCSFTTLAAGATVEINVKGTAPAAVCGKINNSVTVAASNEANTSNNTASVSITVNCPDVKVTKTAVNGSIHLGDDAIYNIVVENIGAGTAYNVTLADTLPGTMTWALVQPVTGCAITGNTLSCSFASLAAGAKITIQVKATTISPTQCVQLTNTVTVAATNEKAADTANNTSSASITVTCPADLTISKTASATFKRTFSWDISKTVNKNYVEQVSGSVVFNYSVLVKETSFADSDWVVKGKITVTNPNSWVGIPLSGLADQVDNGGTCAITGFTAGTTVPAGGSLVFDYSCTYAAAPTPYAGTNSATATWDASVGTPHGTATATADFTFDTGTSGNPTNVNKTVTVKDTFKGATKTLGTLTAVTTLPYTSKTFTYSYSVPVPAGICLAYTNTARIVETGQTASQTVTVCGSAKTGARTLGFWKETNGQNLIKTYCVNGTANLGVYLAGLGTGNGPFKNAPTTCSLLAPYITNVLNGASSTDMNKMLKAQMLATALDVWFTGPGWTSTRINAVKPPSAFFQHNNLGTFQMETTAVCPRVGSLKTGTVNCSNGLPGTDAVLAGVVPTSPMTMQAILDHAASVPPFNGSVLTSVWFGGNRIKEEILKNLFDQFNNQLAFGTF